MNDFKVPIDWFLEWVKNATHIRTNYPHRTNSGWAISPNVCTTTFGTPCTYRLLPRGGLHIMSRIEGWYLESLEGAKRPRATPNIIPKFETWYEVPLEGEADMVYNPDFSLLHVFFPAIISLLLSCQSEQAWYYDNKWSSPRFLLACAHSVKVSHYTPNLDSV
jgi:hypothetical protein